MKFKMCMWTFYDEKIIFDKFTAYFLCFSEVKKMLFCCYMQDKASLLFGRFFQKKSISLSLIKLRGKVVQRVEKIICGQTGRFEISSFKFI